MKFVYDLDGNAKVDGTVLPGAELLAVGPLKPGQPVRIVLAVSADVVAIAHSAELDRALE